jgi:hypothetical protein
LTRGSRFFFEIFHAGQACPAKMGRPFENGPWFPSDRIFFAPNVQLMYKAKRTMDAGQSCRNHKGTDTRFFCPVAPDWPLRKGDLPEWNGDQGTEQHVYARKI